MQEQKKQLYKKWMGFAVAGLMLCGFGLSLFGEALGHKLAGEAWWYWALWGTGALSVFNAGISLFGQAVLYRVELNALLKTEQKEEKP